MTIQLLIIRLNFEVKVDSLGDMANGIKVTYNGTLGFPYSGINYTGNSKSNRKSSQVTCKRRCL